MTSGAPSRLRLRSIRLLELSPLLLFVLASAIWFSMPQGMRTAALAVATPDSRRMYSDMSPELIAVTTLHSVVQEQTQRMDANPEDPAAEFSTAADDSTLRVMRDSAVLHGGAGVVEPFAVPADPTAWDPVRAYEKATGGRVAVFALEPVEATPLALAAVDSLDRLTPGERREYETSRTVGTLRLAIRHALRGAPATGTQLPLDLPGTGADQQLSTAGRSVRYTTRQAGDHLYEVYFISRSREAVERIDADALLPDPAAIDTPSNRRAIKRAARALDGAVFAVGPVERLVPLRAPGGLSADKSTGLMDSAGVHLQEAGTGVHATDPRVARLKGAGPWTAVTLSTSAAGLPGSAGSVPLVYVAFWQRHPAIDITWKEIGKTPWRVLLVWLVTNAASLLGGLAVLFAASLVASPLAFAHERRLTAQVVLDSERERLRREARDRVVERLTELSGRIEAAASQTPVEAPDQLGLAARDIDTTIAELRGILGSTSTEGGDRRG